LALEFLEETSRFSLEERQNLHYICDSFLHATTFDHEFTPSGNGTLRFWTSRARKETLTPARRTTLSQAGHVGPLRLTIGILMSDIVTDGR
jgi:hypothetical protein